jgi:hypothetical protein
MKTVYDLCPCNSGKKIKYCCLESVKSGKNKALAALLSTGSQTQCFAGNFKEGHGTIAIIRTIDREKYVIGYYLIDALCRGVKNAEVATDIDNIKLVNFLTDMKEHGGLTQISYEEARNFIFGSIAFAKKIDINPHANWEYAQYMLEPYQPYTCDFTFGIEGKHVYIHNPEDPIAHSQEIMAKVKKAHEHNKAVEPTSADVDEEKQ